MQTSQIKASINKADKLRLKLDAMKKQLQIEIKQLDKAGHVDGTLHQQAKDKKNRPDYLVWYLNHRNTSPRVREYIGIDPKRLAEAKARIKRHATWLDKKAQLAAVESARDYLKREIDYTLSRVESMSKTQRRMW